MCISLTGTKRFQHEKRERPGSKTKQKARTLPCPTHWAKLLSPLGRFCFNKAIKKYGCWAGIWGGGTEMRLPFLGNLEDYRGTLQRRFHSPLEKFPQSLAILSQSGLTKLSLSPQQNFSRPSRAKQSAAFQRLAKEKCRGWGEDCKERTGRDKSLGEGQRSRRPQLRNLQDSSAILPVPRKACPPPPRSLPFHQTYLSKMK